MNHIQEGKNYSATRLLLIIRFYLSKMNYTEKGKNDSATHQTIVIINCVLNASLMLISIIGDALVLAAKLRTPDYAM